MLEGDTKQGIRIYCPTHGVFVPFLKASKVQCDGGPHFISEDFPYSEFWEYCCDCETFCPSNLADGSEAENNCRVCKRKVSIRYLCSHCRVMSLKSEDFAPQHPFTLLKGEAPQPACPGCAVVPQAPLREHECYVLFEVFSTARESCPFCYEPFLPVDNAKAIDAGEDSPCGSANDSEKEGFESEAETFVPPGRIGFSFRKLIPSLNSQIGRLISLKSWTWPKTRKRKMEFIAFVLTLGGFLLTFFGFPVIYSYASWIPGKWNNKPPLVKMIECSNRAVLEGEKIPLKALAEDRNGDNLQFEWNCSAGQIEGSGARVLLNTSGVKAQVVPFKILVNLKVTDPYGETASGETEIYIMPPDLVNSSPVLKTIKCICNEQEIRAGDKVSLTAIADDPDGDKLEYDWQSSTGQIEGAGSSVTLDSSSVNPQSTPVPIKVTLTVSDGRGRSVSNDITINVTPKQAPGNTKELSPAPTPSPNSPPILVMFQPERSVVQVGESVKLEAIATDPNNDKLIYEWETNDGQIEGGGPTVMLNTSHVNPERENVVVFITVTIRDGRGASASGKMRVNVVPPPKPNPTTRPTPASSSQNMSSPRWRAFSLVQT